MVTSHTNTLTVRRRPTQKKEIGRFWNGLVCELKVNERKLFRQSKSLCSYRRNQFLETEDYTIEHKLRGQKLTKEMRIKFKSEEISTTGEDCSKSNSKEK